MYNRYKKQNPSGLFDDGINLENPIFRSRNWRIQSAPLFMQPATHIMGLKVVCERRDLRSLP
jgi:hypothetical protein